MSSLGGIAVPHVEGFIEHPDVVRARAIRRIKLMGGCILLFLSAMGARGVQLCIQPDERIIAAGSTQRWEQMILRANRGRILAKDARPLATSVKTPNVVIDPTLVGPDEVEGLSAQLASILEKPTEELTRLMTKKTKYAKLASRVHPEIAQAALEIKHSDPALAEAGVKHPAIFTETDSRRYYPERALGSHVLGYVNGDGDGQMGLEKSMDRYLRGSTVLLQRRRDQKGLDVDRFRQVDRTSPAGMDVHTTIDRQIQHYTEQAVQQIVEDFEPAGVMAVVVDVDTGDILGLANAPTYNPNSFGDDANLRRNRAVQDAFEPGSVIKPFILGAALDEDKLTANTSIDCEGGVWYVGRSRIREVLGYLKDFGFSARTDVPLPGERTGFMRSSDKIKPIELATTSYGQGMTVTALQLAMATAAIANGGVRMRPRLVTQVVDEHGVPAWIQRPEPAMRALSAQSAQAVTRMMVSVVEPGGTGTKAAVPGYTVAGKTGTAQKVSPGEKTYGKARIGSFVGFLPAEKPELAIVIVVDEPQGPVKYGGWVAGPAFRSIASQSMAYLGIPPTHPIDEDEEPNEDALAMAEEMPDEAVFSQGAWSMPDLRGQTLRGALMTIHGLGLNLEISGSGVLVSQTPPPGAAVQAGAQITLHFEPQF